MPFFTPMAISSSDFSYVKPFSPSKLTNLSSGFESTAAIAPGLSETYPSILPELNATTIEGKFSIASCLATPFIWSMTL